MWEAAEE
jgi:small nuclear ribonucleoprotein D3